MTRDRSNAGNDWLIADIILASPHRIGLIVGMSRAITDYHYRTYLSDLAVDRDYRRQCNRRELIAARMKRLGLDYAADPTVGACRAIVLPAHRYALHDSCWIDRSVNECPQVDASAR